MKIIMYLGFTLLSVLIQFCVMDFIQERQAEEKSVNLNNATSPRKYLKDVVKEIQYKPLAIYYQDKMSLTRNDTGVYVANGTENDDNIYTTTEYSTTLLEEYFDNTTFTVETFTSEPEYKGTEFDNVTEMTFFGNNNETTPKPNQKPKKSHKSCNCNLLYKVCDIGCCCDDDCTDTEIEMFPNCVVKNTSVSTKKEDVCYTSLINFSPEGLAYKALNSLFCIIKINLPEEKRILKYSNFELDQLKNTDQYLTWRSLQKPNSIQEFSNKIYEFGDILGVLKNDTVSSIEIPTNVMNGYCTGRKPITFMKDESFSCKVKILDLEMLKITSNLEYPVISATKLSMNHSVVNCSNAHCTNWTILVCDNLECKHYNKSLHEPFCTERECTNLALKITYIFNYHESKITNATIKFDIQNVSINLHYLEQTIKVNFVLANESIDSILKLSGNPGYIEGLPVIVSRAVGNHTQIFFNTSTVSDNKYYSLPINNNGVCVPTTDNVVEFGRNLRTTCKLYHEHKILQNRSMECKSVQDNIYQFLSLTKNFSFSPLGNPQDLKDNDWMLFDLPINKGLLFGGLKDKISILYCYNINTRFSWIFSYAKINGDNRILSVNLKYTGKNITLNTEEAFTTLTIDINFIDVTKPSVYETPTGPNLNLRLPNDFFYPFNSSGNSISKSIFVLLCYCIIMFAFK